MKAAREKLASGGILAERIGVTARPRRFKPEWRASAYRELGALLTAGIPMVRALDLLIQSSPTFFTGLLGAVRDRVREGAGLADSLRGAGAQLTGFECAVIEAGERAGTLAPILTRLADFLEDQEQLRERVQRALIYPAIVVAVGLCVAVVMLGVLVPRAESLLAGSGRPLPALTRGMLAVGKVVGHWGWLGLTLAVAGAVYARRALAHSETAQRWDRRLFSIPVWGAGYRVLSSLRFSRTMAILLRGGVSLVDAIALSGAATGSRWVAALSVREAEAVRHGARLSDAVRRIGPLEESLAGWIRIGEETGDLAGLLEHAGNRFADHWNRYISRSLALLEPALLLVIGSFVLLVTLAVLLPVLSLANSITLR